MAAENIGNLKEYTVSELAGAVRRALEDGFAFVRVRGEVGRVVRHANGHTYLDLKDADASIAGVIWRPTVARLKVAPEQGMEVVATGRVSTFAPQSKYQLVIDSLEPAGVGALMALLDERKKKLAAEGLFAPARKKQVPYLPETIGVVTSPTGAVIRDILHRLRERFPRRVIVWPTPVQGRGAELKIAAAIEGFNALPESGPVPRPDVLIVARGGGSLEDLWCFNEEVVARAAAASRIPLISAVGHETDTTLIDFAADLRAPTPTAAAEKAVPVRAELLAELLNKERRLVAGAARGLDQRRTRLVAAARGLGRPEDAVGRLAQRFDRAADRLAAALVRAHAAAETRFARVASRLSARLLALRARDGGKSLARDGARLARAAARIAEPHRRRLDAAAALLRSLSHVSVLERGFALVRKAGGALARRAADLPAEGDVSLVFADGERAAVLGRAGAPAPSGRKSPGARRSASQKSLFD
jgi:exodeoxyribonuclease VII large subunit